MSERKVFSELRRLFKSLPQEGIAMQGTSSLSVRKIRNHGSIDAKSVPGAEDLFNHYMTLEPNSDFPDIKGTVSTLRSFVQEAIGYANWKAAEHIRYRKEESDIHPVIMLFLPLRKATEAAPNQRRSHHELENGIPAFITEFRRISAEGIIGTVRTDGKRQPDVERELFFLIKNWATGSSKPQ